MVEKQIISQAELDSLLHINDFIEQAKADSLISEIKQAILNSGKLELRQWQALRNQIREIEEFIPHIDLIIKLKKESEYKNINYCLV
ncbi:hypothetical protein [Colwellia sp. MEBiC06753]